MKNRDAPGHECKWGADLLKMKAPRVLSGHGHFVE
jgi:hypothetical protein